VWGGKSRGRGEALQSEPVCCGSAESAESADSAPLDPDSTRATSHWVNINPGIARHGQIRGRLPSADMANNHTHIPLAVPFIKSLINLHYINLINNTYCDNNNNTCNMI